MLLAAVISVVALFGGWRLLIEPDLKKLAVIDNEKKSQSGKNELLQRIQMTETKIKSYAPQLAKTKETSWLIEDINRIAKESGVVLTAINPGTFKEFKNYEKIYLNLEAECNYNELGHFVSQLENSPRFIKISSIKMARPPEGDNADSGKLKVSMSVGTFRASKELEALFA